MTYPETKQEVHSDPTTEAIGHVAAASGLPVPSMSSTESTGGTTSKKLEPAAVLVDRKDRITATGYDALLALEDSSDASIRTINNTKYT